MLDTTVFNRLVDGQLAFRDLAKSTVFATHIQRDELEATPDSERRSALLDAFERVSPTLVPTIAGIWGISRWGGFRYGKEARFQEAKVCFDWENKAKGSRCLDLHYRTAQGLILVSDDSRLRQLHGKLGGATFDSSYFSQL